MNVSRRQLLEFFGGATAVAAFSPTLTINAAQAATVSFTPVRTPHPLPIFQDLASYLPTDRNGVGTTLPPAPVPSLASYTVIDDVVVPPQFERYVILAWGDKVFPNTEEYVGYNHDWTGYVPIAGTNEGYLWVNHEYTSYPFSVYVAGNADNIPFGDAFSAATGYTLPALPANGLAGLTATQRREVLGEHLYNVGGSLVRIRRDRRSGRYAVVSRDPANRRYHALSGLGINASRTDGYAAVTSWGSRSYQQGDQRFLVGTGPAATDVFEGVNADTLGNRIIGITANCSGGTSPWGSFYSCEENFNVFGAIGVSEDVGPNGTQLAYPAGSSAQEFGLVGEKYGWVVEYNPRGGGGRKHTALGRFRHENVAFRADIGKKLAIYMGDDRRGGHTWKFVSDGTVTNPTDSANSSLLENGTLYVARFNADGTGRWIPLRLSTPTDPIAPSVLGSAEFAARGAIDRNGLLRLPRRVGIAGQTINGGSFQCTTANQATALPGYQSKTLADFYLTQGAVLCDAFLAANLVGGTPTARPEDIEVHPATRSVYIAYTDGIAGSDGYPDSRIFQVTKYSTAVNAQQPSGGIYRIDETGNDPAATTFTWARFATGGEAGAVNGYGFAAVDNLVFDPAGNIWGVIDMSTEQHNGFDQGAAATPRNITHTGSGPVVGNVPSNLHGVYGNNWMFYIPTSGPDAGTVVPFAIGPVRCEMTGPTFVGDHLILSVQHPCEDVPLETGSQVLLNRNTEMLALDGTLFTQSRTVPRSSHWPSSMAVADGGAGNPLGIPKPATIGIRRKSGGSFV